ncbi:hypothetical protein EXIGLDRAFT_760159 [Exidia glandulosa HHB12029]|uniref:Uncharacterized protein n=1 Tax=Exidia glandulosa HHB12029 TaxID=1314781 RepID=A0A165PL27_EXIGL|nr:hypothetical protein EXIGLDRAFT_760159 [Exidia glandulosa HHB12029]
MDSNVPASIPPGSRGTLTSERAGVPEQPPDWGRTPGAKPRSSRKTATDDDDEPGDENSFRAIAAEFFQSTKAEIVDMMAEQAVEIRTTKDLVNQLLTALNDLKNTRGRPKSRDSDQSSQSEHAREQRRAEKQPMREPKSTIEAPLSPPPPSPPPTMAVTGARVDTVNGFTGYFAAIPMDLYRLGGYAFTMPEFLAAQAAIDVPRREMEEHKRWRARAFHAYATEAHKQAKARDIAVARDDKTSAVPRTSTETPIREIPPHTHAPRLTPKREDWGLDHQPTLPQSLYASLPTQRNGRQREPSPIVEPVSAMRSTPMREPVQDAQFTEAQCGNLYGPGVDPMDQRLLLALYTFENKHFSDRLPPKVNGVKMEPPTYAGGGDIATLENFLIKFFKWQMVHGLTDALGFAKALEVMGLCLKGSAERWYATECTLRAESGNDWTFETLIVGLRQRFVHATAKADAKAVYDAICLGPEGVMDLESELNRAAGYLVERPSDYDRRLRFMSALPFAMAQRMIQDGYTAEKSTLPQLVSKAVDLESAAKASAAARDRGTPRTIPVALKQNEERGTYQQTGQSFGRAQFRDRARDRDWNRQQEKPLPPTPYGAGGGNKPFATPPARPGSTFTPRTDPSRSVRGNAAAVEPETDAAESAESPNMDATGTSDNIVPTGDDYQHEITALEKEPGSRDEYDGLGYDERDITGFEIEPDEWLAGEDDQALYERTAWTRMARIVDVEDTAMSDAV